MRRPLLFLLALLAGLGAAAAQEGHPLTGTWGGDWGPNPTERTHVTFVMQWDGEKVSGTINPGPNALQLTSVVVDYANWTVRIEAQGKDASGPVQISADGRLENIGSYHRTITGTWRQGTSTGDFKLTRD